MMTGEPELTLPEHVVRLHDDEQFTFACHPGVACFTDCCRQLELALSPYDVLRLARALGCSSRQVLDRSCLIEKEENDIFPQVYLGMVDDGKASCPFVNERGCKVYEGRPAACRTYPLGRGAWQDDTGRQHCFYVLLHEHHCLGFAEPQQHDLQSWIAGQGINDYYAANDILLALLQHERIRNGYLPSARQRELYINTLYDLEGFAARTERDLSALGDHDLLQQAVQWLINDFFGQG